MMLLHPTMTTNNDLKKRRKEEEPQIFLLRRFQQLIRRYLVSLNLLLLLFFSVGPVFLYDSNNVNYFRSKFNSSSSSSSSPESTTSTTKEKELLSLEAVPKPKKLIQTQHSQTQTTTRRQTPPQPNKTVVVNTTTTTHIMFIHIPKSGGTSIGHLVGPMMNNPNYTHMNKRNRHYHRVGKEHFDWTYVEAFQSGSMDMNANLPRKRTRRQRQDKAKSPPVDIITFFRDPAKRVVSQFYYSKPKPFAKKLIMYNQTIEEFSKDKSSQEEFDMVFDGMGGPSWLTGHFKRNYPWIVTDKVRTTRLLSSSVQNRSEICLLAAHHLQQTKWFGILEDIDRSLKLLQIYLELDDIPKYPHQNSQKYDPVSAETIDRIRRLIPMDIWLYEYAKLLFDARYKFEVDGQPYILPSLPPFPWDD